MTENSIKLYSISAEHSYERAVSLYTCSTYIGANPAPTCTGTGTTPARVAVVDCQIMFRGRSRTFLQFFFRNLSKGRWRQPAWCTWPARILHWEPGGASTSCTVLADDGLNLGPWWATSAPTIHAGVGSKVNKIKKKIHQLLIGDHSTCIAYIGMHQSLYWPADVEVAEPEFGRSGLLLSAHWPLLVVVNRRQLTLIPL
jgi:hypothetical protein